MDWIKLVNYVVTPFLSKLSSLEKLNFDFTEKFRMCTNRTVRILSQSQFNFLRIQQFFGGIKTKNVGKIMFFCQKSVN